MRSASYDFYLVPVEQYVRGIMAWIYFGTGISRFKVTSWEHFILLIHVVFWEYDTAIDCKLSNFWKSRDSDNKQSLCVVSCKCQTCACPNKTPTIDYKNTENQKPFLWTQCPSVLYMPTELSTLRSLVSFSTSVGQKRDWNVGHFTISDRCVNKRLSFTHLLAT